MITDQQTINSANSADANAIQFIFERMLGRKFFIELCVVNAVYPNEQEVTITPLVSRVDHNGNQIPNSKVYRIKYLRLQWGNSAIIANPAVGDIGMMFVCDRDISVVRDSKKESVPGSNRNHARTDGVYFGGLLNPLATQSITFSDNGIQIISPNAVTVNCQQATIKAESEVFFDTPLAKFAGDVIDNANSNSVTLKTLRDHYNSHNHAVSGVQGGSDTVTSNAPNNPV